MAKGYALVVTFIFHFTSMCDITSYFFTVHFEKERKKARKKDEEATEAGAFQLLTFQQGICQPELQHAKNRKGSKTGRKK